MKIIDMHHHLLEEKNYVDNLLREMDRLKIEKTALIGLGKLVRGLFVKKESANFVADNNTVAKICKNHPDRFFGLGFVRLGVDRPEKIDILKDQGFKGLKLIIPKKRYCDEEYFPFYRKAVENNLPCLFHTGIICLPNPKPKERVSSEYMNVIHLEAIAQVFPELKIIIAHLGIQDYLTALTMIRIFPNIYADLSGSTPGWRANFSMEDWRRLLWFPNASEKILFGSDVHWDEIEENLDIYRQIFNAAGWKQKQVKNILYSNAQKIFKL